MALEGGGWLPWSGLFTPGKKDLASLVQEAELPSGPVWMGTEDLTPTGN